MRVIKFLLYAILAIVVVVLIAGIFIKKDYHFEKTKEINASKAVVWDNISTFKNQDKWSQWRLIDPNMKTEITGVDGTVGCKMTWDSKDSKVRSGTQTIANIIPGERLDLKLNFGGSGDNSSYYKVTGDSTKCSVTWALDMHMGYPMNVMGFAMGGMMDDMFEKGLTLLKETSEQKK